MITNSALETEKFGEKLAKKIKKGGVIALYGDLGSGKTTFVKGLARGLRIKKRIVSPTFIFVRPYIINRQPTTDNRQLLYHIDLYRIDKLEDARGLGLEEIFSDSNNIVVIEWAERIKQILPEKRTDIYFKYLDENKRKVMVKYFNDLNH